MFFLFVVSSVRNTAIRNRNGVEFNQYAPGVQHTAASLYHSQAKYLQYESITSERENRIYYFNQL